MRSRAKQLSCLDVLTIHGLRKGRGSNQQICCPVHDEKRSSCSVRERSFKCFSCGAQGDVLDLVGALEGLEDYRAKLTRVLAHQGIDYDQEREAFIARERGQKLPERPSARVGTYRPTSTASSGLEEPTQGFERSASAPRIWGNMLDRLRLEDAAPTLERLEELYRRLEWEGGQLTDEVIRVWCTERSWCLWSYGEWTHHSFVPLHAFQLEWAVMAPSVRAELDKSYTLHPYVARILTPKEVEPHASVLVRWRPRQRWSKDAWSSSVWSIQVRKSVPCCGATTGRCSRRRGLWADANSMGSSRSSSRPTRRSRTG